VIEGSHFWEDRWIGTTTLSSNTHPYIILLKGCVISISIKYMVYTCFYWGEMVGMAKPSALATGGHSKKKKPDNFKWSLTPTWIFFIKSMNVDYINGHSRFLKKYSWRIKVPLKFRTFMWFFLLEKIYLTRITLLEYI
jgi:hypothetical protein